MPLSAATNPSTTEQLRLKAQYVQEGDRIIDAPAQDFAIHGPFDVVAVSSRDCHGMVSIRGEEKLLFIAASASVLVEREEA